MGRKLAKKPIIQIMYDTLEKSLNTQDGFENTTLEEFLSTYKSVCMYGTIRFYFKKESTCEQVFRPWHSDADTISLSLYNGKFYNIPTIRKAFPFMEMKKNSDDRSWYCEWFDTQLLLKSLPTRRNFIDEILLNITDEES